MTLASPDQDRRRRLDNVATELLRMVWLMTRRATQVVRVRVQGWWRHLRATSPLWFVALFAGWLVVAAVIWVALLVWVFLL